MLLLLTGHISCNTRTCSNRAWVLTLYYTTNRYLLLLQCGLNHHPHLSARVPAQASWLQAHAPPPAAGRPVRVHLDAVLEVAGVHHGHLLDRHHALHEVAWRQAQVSFSPPL